MSGLYDDRMCSVTIIFIETFLQLYHYNLIYLFIDMVAENRENVFFDPLYDLDYFET